jgi:hypothetical protein
MSNRVQNAMPALMVVGLGMVLIAGLAGVVLWLVTRRRTVIASPSPSPELAGGQPAEA